MAGRPANTRSLFRSLWWFLILLVGASSGMTAAFAGADHVESLGLAVLGFVVGAIVLWIAFPKPSGSSDEDDRLEWD